MIADEYILAGTPRLLNFTLKVTFPEKTAIIIALS